MEHRPLGGKVAVALPGGGEVKLVGTLQGRVQHGQGVGENPGGQIGAHHLMEVPQQSEPRHIGGSVDPVLGRHLGSVFV